MGKRTLVESTGLQPARITLLTIRSSQHVNLNKYLFRTLDYKQEKKNYEYDYLLCENSQPRAEPSNIKASKYLLSWPEGLDRGKKNNNISSLGATFPSTRNTCFIPSNSPFSYIELYD
jgi:hypothetical protein